MTIQIKHQFVSLKGDGTDATQVQPSYWNAAHSFTMATNSLVGRLTAGVGAAEEIPISAYMASLLNTPDAATLAGILGLFETGDMKTTLRTSASPGWLLMVGGTGQPANTIGNGVSGAALRANADTFNLYSLIYTAVSDTYAPVSGGRTGNATNDFNSGKTIQVPNPVGRSPMGAGSASNASPGTGSPATTARILGAGYGEENHTLAIGAVPAHFHAAGISDPGHAHSTNAAGAGSLWTLNPGSSFNVYQTSAGSVFSNTTGVRVTSSNGLDTTYSTGGGGSHNTIHSVLALNFMVKL